VPGPSIDFWPGRVWLFGVLLVAVTAIAYLPVWRAGFIWDDDTFVWRNPLIQSHGGLSRLWFTTAAQDYFPLTSTTLWLEWRLWGANPLGYHLVNVLLHALSAVLVWRVLERLKVPGAALAAAIFAVHPVNVESVAWITERKNTLAMVFYLLSLLLYLRAEDGRKARTAGRESQGGLGPSSIFHAPSSLLYSLSLVAFACALLSKTAVAPLPVVLLGLAWWRRGRLGLREVARTIPFFGIAAAAGLVGLWFQYHRAIGASMLDVRSDSFWSRLAGAGWALWFYLYKALLPVHLSFVYPRWRIDATQVGSYVPGALVLAALLVCWRYRSGWGKAALLGLGYFVLMLLPVLGFLNIYFMRYSLVADHWQYFAIIGPIALAAAGITAALEKFDGRQCEVLAPGSASPPPSPCLMGKRRSVRRATVGGALVLVLGVLTWREALTYRDLRSLWTASVARNPSAGLAHNNLGTLLLTEGQVDEALDHLRQAVILEPNAADVQSNLGAALLRRGLMDEAMVHLRQAVKLQPDSALAHSNLGNALSQQGHREEALAHLQEAARLQPGLASAHYNLGLALLQTGRADEAIVEFRRVLALEPAFAEAHMSLGNVLLAKGQGSEALDHLQKALELQPTLAAGRLSLANALVQQGRAEEAIAQFGQVLAMQPRSAVAHNGLGNALLQKGRTEEALAHYQAALRIEPRFAEAHLNMANLLLQQQQLDRAITHFQAALKLQPDLAAAHNNLANALLTKGSVDDAIVHFEQALKLQPNLAQAHNGLANAFLRKGRMAEAVTHYEAALAALPNHPYLLNNLAWVMATCPDASIRNGPRAIELAQQAERVTGGKDPALLGTLAAAYAEAGRFAEAVATAQRALELATAQANTNQVETSRARLKLYQANSPFRDSELSPRAAPRVTSP
jgi:protein O-mannosyl-transferase